MVILVELDVFKLATLALAVGQFGQEALVNCSSSTIL